MLTPQRYGGRSSLDEPWSQSSCWENISHCLAWVLLPLTPSHVNYYKGSDEDQRAPKSSVRGKISSSLVAMSQQTPTTTELPMLGDTTAAFGLADFIVVVCYFAFVLTVGIWVSPQSDWV